MDALKTDFQIRGKGSKQNLSNIARARTDFGVTRAASLTAEQVDRYVQDHRPGLRRGQHQPGHAIIEAGLQARKTPWAADPPAAGKGKRAPGLFLGARDSPRYCKPSRGACRFHTLRMAHRNEEGRDCIVGMGRRRR